jgi:hypothetical protein
MPREWWKAAHARRVHGPRSTVHGPRSIWLLLKVAWTVDRGAGCQHFGARGAGALGRYRTNVQAEVTTAAPAPTLSLWLRCAALRLPLAMVDGSRLPCFAVSHPLQSPAGRGLAPGRDKASRESRLLHQAGQIERTCQLTPPTTSQIQGRGITRALVSSFPSFHSFFFFLRSFASTSCTSFGK